VLTGHQDAVNSVVFSPDGTLLASVSRDGTVWVWGHNTMIKAIKLGLEIRDLSWRGDLLSLAVDRSIIILRIARTPA
jgi:WD40 repeat protein